jgi:membrane associated rhomboid family serine protease
VTGGVALASLVVTIAWMTGKNIAPLEMNSLAWHGQPWRLVTSALPHVGWIHLLFNLSWLWVFGTLIEERFGAIRMLGLIVLLAAASSAAEYTLFTGGVGLSGVVYGFFGFLWVLHRRDARFADAMDERTAVLFVVWFFLCILFTISKVLPIGNVAHAAGALIGALVGAAVVAPARLRLAARVTLVLSIAAILIGAMLFRPLLNVSGARDAELEQLGYQALIANDNARACRYLRAAAAMRHADPSTWYNLAIAYQRLGRTVDAEKAHRHAELTSGGHLQVPSSQSPGQ